MGKDKQPDSNDALASCTLLLNKVCTN